ncbi:GATA transcription factor 7-like [Dendrobium catenatum]|uniref:GATA transcription factor 12 n=1 Tax=Dendrobium catenatum TaxID=906689 RepID=A0A2I0WM81_9ASPA|nr:GATA transcription factor 7-like [Dendrobium catenatum]PKU76756.1 GATA transcription factor 12 [Dendrobium catenatum]
MIDLPAAAARATAEAEAEALPDDVLLLDFSSDPNCNLDAPTPQLFQDIFDAAIDDPGSAVDGEEEELEWLANKDAFPPLETSFDPVSRLPFRPPSRARSGGRRRRRKALPTFPPSTAPEKKQCRHCKAEETPQWRLGPEGPKTLCNACGVRYNSGRLVPEYRPANSPTFSAAIHSNSHRRVMEIRRRKYGGRRGRPRVRLVSESS